MVEFDQHVKIGIARADQRIAAVDARDLRRAVGLQGLEFLAQPVIQGGVGNPRRRLAEMRLVGRAAIIQPGARSHHAQARDVAQPERIVDVHRRPYAVLAGVAVAGVVGFDAPRHAPPLRHVDDQVGCAHRLTGSQGRFDVHAGNVGQQQQAVLERGDGDRVAAIQPFEQSVCQRIRKIGLVAQGDAAVAALDHGDRHGPVLDVLRGQVGLRHEIPIPAVMVRNLCGHAAQFGERQFAARAESGDRDQFGLGIQRLPGHMQRLDRNLDAIGRRAGRRTALLDADIRNRSLLDRQGWNLLDLTASARQIGGIEGSGCAADATYCHELSPSKDHLRQFGVWHAKHFFLIQVISSISTDIFYVREYHDPIQTFCMLARVVYKKYLMFLIHEA